MSQKNNRKIRRSVKALSNELKHRLITELCSLPFGARLVVSWSILIKRKPKK